jgi:hypothetical protein
MVQRIALPSDVTSGSLMVGPSTADAELLRSAEESSFLSLEPSLDVGAALAVPFYPRTPASPLSSIADVAPTQTLLQHRTACKKSSLRSWRKWQVSSGVMHAYARWVDVA